MKTFRVQFLATERSEVLDEVSSFVGVDPSGSFGLLAGHCRFMTVLSFGLARLDLADGSRLYAGLPGGVLYFVDNELRLSTRRYLLGSDATAIAGTLAQEMLAEEEALSLTRRKLHRLEAQMMQHLAQLDVE